LKKLTTEKTLDMLMIAGILMLIIFLPTCKNSTAAQVVHQSTTLPSALKQQHKKEHPVQSDYYLLNKNLYCGMPI
jgi:cell division protein FtsL